MPRPQPLPPSEPPLPNEDIPDPGPPPGDWPSPTPDLPAPRPQLDDPTPRPDLSEPVRGCHALTASTASLLRRRARIETKAISTKATRCSFVRSTMVFNRR